MPAAPEGEGRVVIRHAAHHVFGRVDPVQESPEAEEAPGEEEFEPDEVEVEVSKHAELERGISFPIGLSFEDSDGVDVVEDKFHGEKANEEADAVEGGAGAGDAFRGVFDLGDIVVEGEDWAGKVEGGVEDVGEVVAEGVVLVAGGCGDAVSFREVGEVELFLFVLIS